MSYTRDDGTAGRRVQLYVLDMGSANGTFVNSQKIEPQKYVQLVEKVMLNYFCAFLKRLLGNVFKGIFQNIYMKIYMTF